MIVACSVIQLVLAILRSEHEDDMQRYRNAGKPQGQKAAFDRSQVELIQATLGQQPRNRAMFLVSLVTCLRSSDLLSLRVRDVLASDGTVRPTFPVIVQKLSAKFHNDQRRTVTVQVSLDPRAREAVAAWMAHARLAADAKLFDLTPSQYRRLVKTWAKACGLDAQAYSGHSTRRTVPSMVYHQSKDIEACRQLLGHTSLLHTSAYLSVTKADAFNAAHDVLKS